MAGLDLSLPKKVRFNNSRLNRLYNLLMMSTLGGMLFKVIYFKEWFAYVEMKDQVKANLWVTHSQNFSEEANSLISTRDFCTNSSKLDYWWSSDPMHQYQNLTCSRVCNWEEDNGNCMNQEELYSREGTQTQVLFYTRMLEQTKPKGTERQVLFPSADLEGIDFRFEITELEHNLMGTGFTSTGKYRSSTKDVLTVLRQSGKQLRVLEPSPTIDLSIQELLTMAGLPNALGEVKEITGKNQKPGAFQTLGPTGRIAGVELAMKIQCHNYHRWTIKGDDKWRSYDGPVCYIDVESSPIAWVTHEMIGMGDKTVYRHFSGVRVKAYGAGDYRSINLDKFFSTIIAVCVLARLPEKFVLFVAVHCLGHLSKIYQRVLFEPFCVQDAVSGLVLRLITVQCLFNVLSCKNGMSKGAMKRRVQKAMEKEEHLDPHELEILVEVVFEHIVGEQEQFHTVLGELAHLGESSMSSIRKMKSSLTDSEEESGQQNVSKLSTEMDLQQFCHTYANQEAINFRDASILFDKDRHISVAEKFFMPTSLRQIIWSEHKISNDEGSDPDEENNNDPLSRRSSVASVTSITSLTGISEEFTVADAHSSSTQESKEVPPLPPSSPLSGMAPLAPMTMWSADTCGKADLVFLEKKMHHAMEERAQQQEAYWEARVEKVAEEVLSHNSQNLNPLDTRLQDVEALIQEVLHQVRAITLLADNAVNLDENHRKDTTDQDMANFKSVCRKTSEKNTKEQIQLSSTPARMPFGHEGGHCAEVPAAIGG